ncbi:MAG: translation initiation factor IF-2 N-terminal domain-containing protein [Verrucomicrobiota bacterium]
MKPDYTKRGNLLPEGCKDLIDVLRLKAKTQALRPRTSTSLPPIIGEIVVPEHTTVSQLASLLNLKPFQLVADLMEIGVFANVHHELTFTAITRIARRRGYIAK